MSLVGIALVADSVMALVLVRLGASSISSGDLARFSEDLWAGAGALVAVVATSLVAGAPAFAGATVFAAVRCNMYQF